MHHCTIYGLHGPGSRTQIEIDPIEVAANLLEEQRKIESKRVRITLREKTTLGLQLALR